MTKIKYVGKCKNLNELYVLYSQALKQVINIKDNCDNVEKNMNIISQMEAINSVFGVLKQELIELERKIKIDNSSLTGIRRDLNKQANIDIKEMIKNIREQERGDKKAE